VPAEDATHLLGTTTAPIYLRKLNYNIKITKTEDGGKPEKEKINKERE